jgi:ribonuclease HII
MKMRKTMKIAGIDEAGKGPVIGPMCVAGVIMDESNINALKNLGVADSKKLSPKKRENLARQIRKYAEGIFIQEIEACQIDELRNIMSMNDIMIRGFSSVLENLKPDLAYVDAADVNAERFGKKLLAAYENKHEGEKKPEIVSEHRADEIYPIVSAASIIAKVRRDELIGNIKESINEDFGSGYPSDPKTKKFLQEWMDKNGNLPDFVRHSWKTAAKLKASR